MTDESSCRKTESRDARFQRRKFRLRSQIQAIEQQHATNESINTLLSVVRYLNTVQDGDGVRIDNTYERTDIDRQSRILNCHEEDIINISLIAMKRLIASLIPATSNQPQPPAKTSVTTSTEADDAYEVDKDSQAS